MQEIKETIDAVQQYISEIEQRKKHSRNQLVQKFKKQLAVRCSGLSTSKKKSLEFLEALKFLSELLKKIESSKKLNKSFKISEVPLLVYELKHMLVSKKLTLGMYLAENLNLENIEKFDDSFWTKKDFCISFLNKDKRAQEFFKKKFKQINAKDLNSIQHRLSFSPELLENLYENSNKSSKTQSFILKEALKLENTSDLVKKVLKESEISAVEEAVSQESFVSVLLPTVFYRDYLKLVLNQASFQLDQASHSVLLTSLNEKSLKRKQKYSRMIIKSFREKIKPPYKLSKISTLLVFDLTYSIIDKKFDKTSKEILDSLSEIAYIPKKAEILAGAFLSALRIEDNSEKICLNFLSMLRELDKTLKEPFVKLSFFLIVSELISSQQFKDIQRISKDFFKCFKDSLKLEKKELDLYYKHELGHLERGFRLKIPTRIKEEMLNNTTKFLQVVLKIEPQHRKSILSESKKHPILRKSVEKIISRLVKKTKRTF